MRRNVVAGACLAAVSGLIVMLSSALDLNLESVALLGGALGAVIALVPDRTVGIRLAGFGVGFVVAWVGYAVRAAVMPDTAGGRAVVVVLVVLALVAINAATRDRLPLWVLLLGTAAFTGGYEFTYNEAPPELLSTSLTAATTLMFNVAAGFLAASVFSPISERVGGSRRTAHQDEEPSIELDQLMQVGNK